MMILDCRGAKIYFSGKRFLDLLHKVWCHVWNDHKVRTPCHPCRNVIEFVSWWEPFCSYFCLVELKLLFGWLNWKLISISVRRVSHQHGFVCELKSLKCWDQMRFVVSPQCEEVSPAARVSSRTTKTRISGWWLRGDEALELPLLMWLCGYGVKLWEVRKRRKLLHKQSVSICTATRLSTQTSDAQSKFLKML